MHKALIGIMLAASALSPAAAQNSRAQEQRILRGQAQAQQMRAQQMIAAGQAPQAQAQSRGGPPVGTAQNDRGREYRGGRGDRGRGGGDRGGMREHIRETREASQRSAEGLSPRYQQRAAENQRNYERQLRDDRRDGRVTWGNERRTESRQWDGRRGRDGDRRYDGRRGDDRRYGDRRDWGRDWNNRWRDDRRYDWQRHRYSNRNLFRPGRYYAPYRNYSYQRFYVGGILDPLFFGDRYWLNDPVQYRLPPAPYGTRWVRYYDDVVLVDTYSGEILDVINDFFW